VNSGPHPLFEPKDLVTGLPPDPLTAPIEQVVNHLEPTQLEPLGLPDELPEIPEDEPFAARMRAIRSAPTTVAESTIVDELLGWLNMHHRVYARKIHQTAITGSGEPDLDICWHGRAVKIEVKRPGQKPTPAQRRRMMVWRDAGALVDWVSSLDELKAVLSHVEDDKWAADLDR